MRTPLFRPLRKLATNRVSAVCARPAPPRRRERRPPRRASLPAASIASRSAGGATRRTAAAWPRLRLTRMSALPLAPRRRAIAAGTAVPLESAGAVSIPAPGADAARHRVCGPQKAQSPGRAAPPGHRGGGNDETAHSATRPEPTGFPFRVPGNRTNGTPANTTARANAPAEVRSSKTERSMERHFAVRWSPPVAVRRRSSI
jgi:hypothetical protein